MLTDALQTYLGVLAPPCRPEGRNSRGHWPGQRPPVFPIPRGNDGRIQVKRCAGCRAFLYRRGERRRARRAHPQTARYGDLQILSWGKLRTKHDVRGHRSRETQATNMRNALEFGDRTGPKRFFRATSGMFVAQSATQGRRQASDECPNDHGKRRK